MDLTEARSGRGRPSAARSPSETPSSAARGGRPILVCAYKYIYIYIYIYTYIHTYIHICNYTHTYICNYECIIMIIIIIIIIVMSSSIICFMRLFIIRCARPIPNPSSAKAGRGSTS